MDWMTLAIELAGLLILGIWIVVPIAEFKEIIAKIRFGEVPPEERQPHNKQDEP